MSKPKGILDEEGPEMDHSPLSKGAPKHDRSADDSTMVVTASTFSGTPISMRRIVTGRRRHLASCRRRESRATRKGLRSAVVSSKSKSAYKKLPVSRKMLN